MSEFRPEIENNIAFENSFLMIKEKAKKLPVDAVVVLSGGVKKIIVGGEKALVIAGVDITDEDDLAVPLSEEEFKNKTTTSSVRLSSTGYAESKSGFGKAKDIATAQLVKELSSIQNETPIIVTSSKSPNNKTSVTDAEVSARALLKHGVENEIILQNYSIDTLTEILEAVRLAVEKGWKHVVITTTETQKRRVLAIVETILDLQNPVELDKIESSLADNAKRFNRENFPSRVLDNNHYKETLAYLKSHIPKLEVSVVSAEDGLIIRNPGLYGKLIGKLKSTPVYQKKIQQDESDCFRWRSGDYAKRGQPFIEQWRKGDLP